MNDMNTPFTIDFNVKEINYSPDTPTLGITNFPIRVTLRHFLHDIFYQIWCWSPDFRIKPVFLTVQKDNHTLQDDQLFTILDTDIPPLTPVKDFVLVIDYSLYGNRAIPTRDPERELFDIIIEWNDASQGTHSIHLRESLLCTIGVLKDYVAEERNKTVEPGEYVDGSYFNLRYWANDEASDSSMTISDVIGLDVIPLTPVLLELLFNYDLLRDDALKSQPIQSSGNVRFFIKLENNIDSLQQEACLFEINQRTTLEELISQIILRMDHLQVRRTFFDQVILSFNEVILNDNFDTPVYDLIELTEDFLREHRNIVTMSLNIHHHLSGVDGGLLSRQFLHDLTSEDGFRLQTTPHDLDLAIANRTDHQQNGESHIVDENIHYFEPTRIILANGAEWTLTGESFDMIHVNLNAVNLTTVNSGPQQLLVNQSDLSTVEYEFNLNLDGESIVVKLNSSQCIIVDHQNYQPYILLNPSGIAKLNKAFQQNGQSIIQQVKIHAYEPNSSSPRPSWSNFNPPTVPNTEIASFPRNFADAENELRDILRNVNPHQQPNNELAEGNVQPPVPNGLIHNRRARNFNGFELISQVFRFIILQPRDVYISIVKVIAVIFFLGINRLVLDQPLLILVIVGGFCIYRVLWRSIETADFLRRYVLTPRQIDWFGPSYERSLTIIINTLTQFGNYRNIRSNIVQYKLVDFVVQRPRDYELLVRQLNNQFDWKYSLGYNIQSFIQTITLYLITIIPSFQTKIERRLNQWRSNENNDLKSDIETLYKKFSILRLAYERKFHQRFPRDFDVDSIVNYEILQEDYQEEYEVQYQIFLDQYIKLNNLYNECKLCYQENNPVILDEPTLEEPQPEIQHNADSVSVPTEESSDHQTQSGENQPIAESL